MDIVFVMFFFNLSKVEVKMNKQKLGNRSYIIVDAVVITLMIKFVKIK